MPIGVVPVAESSPPLCAVDGCRRPEMCPESVSESGVSALEMHAASHSDLMNRYLHKVVVPVVVEMFRLHGFSARSVVPDECTHPVPPHSCDVIVYNYYRSGSHLRIDVKTGVEFGASNRSRSLWAESRERDTVRQHGSTPVLPFVLGVAGSVGPRAASLLRSLGRRPLAPLRGDDSLTWTVPSHGKYWFRVFRKLMLEGWYNILHEVAGMAPPQLAERPIPSLDEVLSVIDPAASTESAGEYDLWD